MIAFFARNGVAANLLMAAIVISGLVTLWMRKIPIEVFPESESRMISVSVPYRGATPEEVEETIVVRIEEAIANVEGIEEMLSTANSSGGTVTVEVDDDYDRQLVLNEIEARIDAIPDFPPNNAERPTVRIAESSRWVISVVLSGDLTEMDLRLLGETVRDELMNLDEVTGAELQAVRPYEISIEIDETALQRHNLSFDVVARALRNSSIDVPAGTLETVGGEIALRTKGRAYDRAAFKKITVATREDGSWLTIGDIAKVNDGFDENSFEARFNGKRCVLIAVFREGNQSAIRIADQVKEFMEDRQVTLPEGVVLDYWSDSSKIVRGRLHTLLESFWKSILFVFILLTLFLRPSLALWVAVGIPICFLGAIACMPWLGVSINIVSLFGFILVLGVVVDDAIVTGENIYTRQKSGEDPEEASIKGAEEVARPVIFGVFTTMLAFVPLFFLGGFSGSWMPQIAIIVITVLAFSLIESKLILPSHLKHMRMPKGKPGPFTRGQQWIANSVEKFVEVIYQPSLRWILANRYIVLAIFIASMTILIGAFKGNHLKTVRFPTVESERATCRLTMQEGTPIAVTEKYVNMMEQAVFDLKEEYVGEDGISVIEDILTSVGGQGVSSSRSSNKTGQSHQGEVVFYITAPEDRQLKVGTREIAEKWRAKLMEKGGIVGAKELYFRAEIGRGRDPLEVQLTGQRIGDLTKAAEIVRKQMETYDGLFDVSDNLDNARDEIQLKVKPEAEQFGMTMTDLANQVRQAFFGEEIQRIQRGRDEIRVMLRYPQADRRSLAALDGMKIRTSTGQEVPFTTVADATVVKSFPRIERVDRKRVVEIDADADKEAVNLDSIRENLTPFLDEMVTGFPGMSWGFEGEARDAREDNAGMWGGAIIIIFGIYAMLAIPFRSYLQPLIVMSVIPFGLLGAVLGHFIEDFLKADTTGMPISQLSYLGMLALAGVVVNDSLVLVDYVNRRRDQGMSVIDAVNTAGAARFRAIILTSATTFAGLFPLIRMEATQAQFLIPMAVSLGYGILFATMITLVLVPINYLILDDMGRGLRWIFSDDKKPDRDKKAV